MLPADARLDADNVRTRDAELGLANPKVATGGTSIVDAPSGALARGDALPDVNNGLKEYRKDVIIF